MNIDYNLVRVNLAQRAYPIYISHSIFAQKTLWQRLVTSSQVCIVTNETIAPLYLSQLRSIFSDIQCDAVILPDGEAHKNIQQWQRILDELVVRHHKRGTTLIALGGGVIGDIAGFAAASYQRGVNFIQVPTTLLAQVDASIGGKTGINYQQQKNLIGAFYQPKAIIIDTAFLATLPEREFRAGLAEVIKYALIDDAEFFDYLCENINKLLARSNDVLMYVIEMCVKIKIKFIEQDERDETGKRALLNFGHTFGHALESVMNFTILHGEAVAWGMQKACQLSQFMGSLSSKDVARVTQLLWQCDLLLPLSKDIAVEQLLSNMQKDKKNDHNNITLILLQNLGEAVLSKQADAALILQCLQEDI